MAQLRHDHAGLQARFGAGAIGITPGHPVPFFADVAAEWFERLTRVGVGSVVSSEVAVLLRKLALAEGCSLAAIPPEQRVKFGRIVAMGSGRTGCDMWRLRAGARFGLCATAWTGMPGIGSAGPCAFETELKTVPEAVPQRRLPSNVCMLAVFAYNLGK